MIDLNINRNYEIKYIVFSNDILDYVHKKMVIKAPFPEQAILNFYKSIEDDGQECDGITSVIKIDD